MTKTVPECTFKTRVRNDALEGPNPFEWKDVTSDDLFKGKRVVLFALPGAFTPTCSSTHLPGYEKHFDDIKAQGIDDVICLSVNDAFVMYKWGQDMGTKNVTLLPDGSGTFSEGMDMLVAKDNLGFGKRSWRYSMVVNDGVVEKMFSEDGQSDDFGADPFEVSDADTMLAYLKS
jgi:peroxiredoxin